MRQTVLPRPCTRRGRSYGEIRLYRPVEVMSRCCLERAGAHSPCVSNRASFLLFTRLGERGTARGRAGVVPVMSRAGNWLLTVLD